MCVCYEGFDFGYECDTLNQGRKERIEEEKLLECATRTCVLMKATSEQMTGTQAKRDVLTSATLFQFDIRGCFAIR